MTLATNQITLVDVNDGFVGSNGKTYILNILNGARSIIYDATGANPTPAPSQFTAQLLENGVAVTPTSFSWTVTGHLSGTSTISTFTPTNRTTFSAALGVSDSVKLSIVFAGMTIQQVAPIAVGKIGATGSTGVQGPEGPQGVQGPSGTNGATLYTWIKYADSPTTGMSDSPTGKLYMGISYNNASSSESVLYADYSWSLIKGDQGIQGPIGNTGATLYTWIKYADTTTTGMSDSPTGKKYMGIAYNKTTSTKSIVYADYSWSLVEGPQGVAGRGISSTEVTYQASSSGTVTPVGTWLTSVPAVADSQFLWTRTILTYTDTTTTTAYAVGKMGAQGPQGTTGATGNGISETVVTYQAHTSGTVTPTGTWLSSVPSVPASQYLWTRIVISYTGGGSTTSYAVGLMGAQGPQGTAARTYFIEPNTSALIENKDGTYSPTTITFSSYYKDGTSAAKTVYTRYWKIESTIDGVNWTTVETQVATLAATHTVSAIPVDIMAIRATTYAEVGLTTAHTTESVMVVRGGEDGLTGPQGQAGESPISMILSNAAHIIPATYDGYATSFGGATTKVEIYEGLADVTDLWTIVATPSIGAIGVFVEYTYVVTDLTEDSGYIEFVATRTDYPTQTKRFNLTLSRAGQPGESAPVAKIMPSSLGFRSTDGGLTFLPTTITLVPQLQATIFSKWEYSLGDNDAWQEAITGTLGITIDAGTKILTFNQTSSLLTGTNSVVNFKLKTNIAAIYDVATIVKIVDVIDLEVGGKNLLKASAIAKSSVVNTVAQYTMTEDWQPGKLYTVSIKGTLTNGQKFELKRDGDVAAVGFLDEQSAGVYALTLTATVPTVAGDRGITIRNYPPGVTTATIEWIKLEKGRINTDYTEAPQDVEERIASKLENDAQAIIDLMSNNGQNDVFFIDAGTGNIYIKATAIEATGLTADLIRTGNLQSYDGQTYINLSTGEFSFANGAISYLGSTFTIDLAKTNLKAELDAKADKATVAAMSQYLTFTEVDGLTIGEKSTSETGAQNINIKNNALTFNDGGVAVATISGQNMEITTLYVKENLRIGVHQIEKHNAEITLFTWVG